MNMVQCTKAVIILTSTVSCEIYYVKSQDSLVFDWLLEYKAISNIKNLGSKVTSLRISQFPVRSARSILCLRIGF